MPTVRYAHRVGARVEFYSPDNDEMLTGTIEEVEIMLDGAGSVITYTIEADREIKQNKSHFISTDMSDFKIIKLINEHA